MNFTSSQTRYRFQPLLILMASVFVLLLIPSFAFADTIGPSFDSIFPAEGATLSNGTLTISSSVSDIDYVDYNSVLMMVDGTLVSPIKQYGYLDEYTDDYTKLDIYYSTTLTEGSHTVSISVSDKLGNTSTKQWSFSVAQPPKISPVSPKQDATVAEQNPVISVSITDNTGVEATSVELYLNSTKVNGIFDQASGVVSYTPETALTNESWHTVSVSATDISGNASQVTWKFFVNTYGEMTFSQNDATCQQCHQRTVHLTNNCGMCHGINTSSTNPAYPLDDCYSCHYGTTTYPETYHSNGLPYLDPPVTHTAQETDSCVECHGKSWSTAIPAIHSTIQTSERHTTTSVGCTNCHASTLTREHVRRYDDQGQQLNCFTCHNSPDPNVQKAIADKNSACNACHVSLDGSGGHPQHQTGLDVSCQSCHSNTIITEQQFHQTNGCGTCHDKGANETIKYAISSKNTSCTTCHNQGHNMHLVGLEPTDLPKYPGYIWGVPQPAQIMAGEPWLPAEFNSVGSKMLISSRRIDVSATELYNWYNDQMSLAGWEKTGGATEPGSYMVLSYKKASRLATVIIYNGEYHSPEAPTTGYRVEILYK